ncbi:MAG: alpha/beta fold hydrolase [Thermodesulfobacteriota bacterium]
MKGNGTFRPPVYLRNPYVQSMLASSRLRAMGRNAMTASEREMILEDGQGIRLLGYWSSVPSVPKKGLVILLHGWEGSSHSTYVKTTGKRLFEAGYDIFRLNYRDHGPSHHLNEGVFFAIRLDEVFACVKQAALMEKEGPVFLAGFSMGGNFALRIAIRCAREPIPGLAHVAAISPGINPLKSTQAIDAIPVFRWYFLKKWRWSLRKKQELFPDKYDFGAILRSKTVMETTDVFLKQLSDYPGVPEYFKGYTLTGDTLKAIGVPTTIITAGDDPIIPVEDFYECGLNDMTRLIVQPYGGHNGFIERFPSPCWYEQKLIDLFSVH